MESLNKIISGRKHQVVFITYKFNQFFLSYEFTQIIPKSRKPENIYQTHFFGQWGEKLTWSWCQNLRQDCTKKKIIVHSFSWPCVLENVNYPPTFVSFSNRNSHGTPYNLGSWLPSQRKYFSASLASVYSHGINFGWMRCEWVWGGQFSGHLFKNAVQQK